MKVSDIESVTTECPSWCLSEHDEPTEHAADWDGHTDKAGAHALVRSRIRSDGRAVVDLALYDSDGSERSVELTLGQAAILLKLPANTLHTALVDAQDLS